MTMHVITNFAASGGAETMLARLLSVAEGPQTVVSLIESSDRNTGLAANPRARFVDLGARHAAQMPGAALRLARLIREDGADTIMCWMYHGQIIGTLAARLSRRPVRVIWNVRQALDDPAALSRSTRLAVRLARLLSPQAACIVYNSDRARIQHRAAGFAAGRDMVIPNGVVVPPPRQEPPRPARRFGIAARFHPQKDFDTFFAAAAQAAQRRPDLHFVAAGHGLDPSNPAIAEMMRRHALPADRIELRGEQRDMDGFYAGIDALVLSSRTEGFPNVVAEAMAWGRPVVATAVGDTAAIIGDSGVVVPPRRPDLLAGGICDLAARPAAEIAQLGRTARARIEADFSLGMIAERYDRLLRQGGPAPLTGAAMCGDGG
ncbi:glycosyltransferase [Frigidibacter oleivorans]|uniref:glycosyltransferase n=1 Tax=Frigidibacter oleivorans TaxID=2487129 RepID=UPI000F8DF9FC|nr:glycosyltransferase [Frigidibacter oleivorans]